MALAAPHLAPRTQILVPIAPNLAVKVTNLDPKAPNVDLGAQWEPKSISPKSRMQIPRFGWQSTLLRFKSTDTAPQAPKLAHNSL